MLKRCSRESKSDPQRLLSILLVACSLACGSAPTGATEVTKSPLANTQSNDAIIAAAISEIGTDCPWVSYRLYDLLGAGHIFFTDVQGNYGDIAFWDGVNILLDTEWYVAGHHPLAADLMHEAGHALWNLPDEPGPCGNLYDCQHWDLFDFGCPPEDPLLRDFNRPTPLDSAFTHGRKALWRHTDARNCSTGGLDHILGA